MVDEVEAMKRTKTNNSLPAKSKTEYFGLGHKVVSVALAAVLMGFGWPAVNPAQVYAEGDAAAETAQSADTSSQAEEKAAEKAAAKKAAEAEAKAKAEAAKKAAEAKAEKAAAEKAAKEAEAKAKAEAAKKAEEAKAEQAKAEAAAKKAKEDAAAEATEYDIALKLGNASLKLASNSQRISAPATKVTVPANKDFRFTVSADNGYELTKVVATIAGSEKTLKSDANGVYTVSANDLINKVSIKLETKKTEKTPTNDATPIEDSAAKADSSEKANKSDADKKADQSNSKSDEGKASDDAAGAEGDNGNSDNADNQQPAASGDSANEEAGNGEAADDAAANEDQSEEASQDNNQLASLLDTLSNALSRSVSTQSAVNPGSATTVKVDEQVTLSGTANTGGNYWGQWYGCGYTHQWSVKASNGGSTANASLSGNGNTATFSASKAGTYTITHKYCSKNHSNNAGHTSKSETFTITVEDSVVTNLTISGSDSVVQFKTIQLSANVKNNVTWTSSDKNIATVDQNGNVKGVAVGSATITAQTLASDGTLLTATKQIKVTASNSKVNAYLFFLNAPLANADSNGSAEWFPSGGKTELGMKINVDGANFSGKNTYDNVANRVVSWPDGSTGSSWVLPTDNSYWSQVFNSYKSKVEEKLGVTLTEDDVEAIVLHPYKISNNSGTYHLDCKVEMKTKSVITSTFMLWDAGSTGFAQYGETDAYKVSTGGSVSIAAPKKALAPTKTVNGVTYKLQSWYDNAALSGNAVSFPYTTSSNVVFYAKYVPMDQLITVNYYKKGTTEKVAASKTIDGLLKGQTVTENAINVDGYTAVAPTVKTAKAGTDTEINFYYEANDTNYTVNYYWNGTTDKVAESKSGKVKFGDKITESPASISGYTPVSNESQTITAKVEGNEINFYYYKNVDLVANSATETYDGTEKSVSGFTGAPAGADFSAITVGAKGTDAGTYDANFPEGTKGTVDASGKYYINNVENGKLVISPIADEVVVKIKGHQGGETYNGKDQTVSGYDIENISSKLYSDSDFTVASDAKVSVAGKNAGTYLMDLKASDFKNTNKNFANVKFEVVDGQLNIAKRDVTLKSKGLSKEYDGTALTNAGNELEVNEGFVDGEGVTCSFTGSQTLVGSSPNAFTYEFNKGTNGNNYTVIKNEGQLTVNDRAQKFEVEVVANSNAHKYDGKEHSAKGLAQNVFEFNGVSYTVSGLTTSDPVQVNAGSYENVISGTPVVTDENGNDVTSQFTVSTKNGKLEISKRDVTLTSATDSKVYDGKALTNHNVKVAGDGFAEGEGVDYAFTGSQTTPGTSQNTFDVSAKGNTDLDKNYNIVKNFGDLTVTSRDAKYQIEVEANSASATYDGQTHTASGLKTTTFVVDGSTYTVSGLDTTNPSESKAGTYNNDITGTPVVTDAEGNDVSSEFAVSTKPGKLKIAKRQVTITSASDSKVYDGTELTKHELSYSGDGFVEGEGVEPTFTGSQLDVGESDNEFTFVAKDGTDLEGNYEVKIAFGTLEVTPVKDEVIVYINEHGDTVTYDGKSHTVTGYDAQPNNSLYTESDFDFTGKAEVKGTDAGSYDMNVKASDFKNKSKNFTNVKFVVVYGTLVINPAVLTVSTGSDSKVYDGTALTKDEVHVSGLQNGETLEAHATGSQTEVGSSTNGYTLKWNGSGTAKSKNYTLDRVASAKQLGTLTVTERAIDAQGMTVDDPANIPYDGAEHKWAPVVKDGDKTLVEGVDYEVSYDKTDFTNVNGDITVTITGKGNYTGSTEKKYQITPRELTVITGSASKTYDGTALTKDEVTIEGLQNNETVTAHATGSQTEVGSSKNAYELTWDGTAQQKNYNVVSENLGTLTVSEFNNEIEVVTTGGTFVYDGQAHGASVEVKGLPAGYTVSKVSSAAQATNVDEGEVAATADELVIVNAQGVDVTDKLNIKRTDGSIKITPVAIELTANSATKAYDGTELADSGYVVSSGTFVGDEGLESVKVEGSQTEVGSSDNLIKGHEVKSNTKDSNYKFTYKKGTLTVTDDVDPDKVITKTHESNAYNVGDEVTFVISAKNIYSTAKDMTFSELPGVKLAQSEFKNVAPGETVSTTATYVITEADVLAGSFSNTATVSFGDKKFSADDEVTTAPVNPQVNVTKQTTSKPANGSAYGLGETIEYKIVVKNNGNVTATNVKVSDDNADGFETKTIKSLAPGEEVEYTAKHKVTESDVIAGTVVNNATATATGPKDTPIDPTPGKTEDKTGPSDPHVQVVKTTTSKPSNGVAYGLGEVITYEIVVTNTGNLTLSNVEVSDDNADGFEAKTIDSLAPGESAEFKAQHKVTEADIQSGTVVNNATATATSPDPDKETKVDPGKTEDPTETPNAHVTITKAAEQNGSGENGAFKLGEVIKYKINVTNTGNVTATNVKVSDDNADGFETKTIKSLAPGKTVSFDAVHKVTQVDILAGKVVNVATGEAGTDVPVTPGTEESDTDTINTDLVVEKTAKAPADGKAYKLGEEVTYEVKVSNKGNVDYSNVKVNDAQTGLSETIDSLPVNGSKTFTTTHVVTEEDIAAGTYTNVATAVADPITDNDGNVYTPAGSDDETIGATTDKPIVDPQSKLEVKKTVTNKGTGENGTFKLGDTIEYKISVTNKGNLTVKDFVISDNNADGFEPVTVALLEPGKTYEVKAQHQVTSDDILAGTVHNVAVAEGGNTPDPGTKPDPGKGEADQPVDAVKVDLEVTKTASDPADGVEFKAGEPVEYAITVTNKGNVDYKNVKVNDPKTGLSKTIAKLEVGQTVTFTTVHRVTEADVVAGTFTNVVTAKGDSVKDPKTDKMLTPEAKDTETIGVGTDKPIEPSDPSIDVKKTSNASELHEDGLLKEGDVVTYVVTVANTGNLTLSNIKVNDLLKGAKLAAGQNDTIAKLAPGEDASVTYTYTVTRADVVAGKVHNEATAKAETPDPDKPAIEPVAPGTTDDPTEATKPMLVIQKTDGNASKVAAGDTIEYNLHVTNNGNVDLVNVVITDQLTGLNHRVGDLAKGASVDISTSYTVTEDDVIAGEITNIATGTAQDETGKDAEVAPGEVTTSTTDMISGLLVKKTAKNGVYGEGDTVGYEIAVTNTGNVALKNVKVVDEKTGFEQTADFNAGETKRFETTYKVTADDVVAGKVVNVATATGVDPKGAEVKAEDTETVTNEPQTDPMNPDKPSLKRSFEVGTLTDVVYNGESQYQKPQVTDGGKILTEGVDYILTPSADTTNVGEVTIKVEGIGNYAGTIDRSYRITPATLVVTTGSATKSYDGTALKSDQLTIKGLKGTDKVTARTTGSQTEVGSSTNTYEMDWGATKSENYVVTEELGTLTVHEAVAPEPVPTPDVPTPVDPDPDNPTPDNPGTTPGSTTPSGNNGTATNGGNASNGGTSAAAAVAGALQGAIHTVTGEIDNAEKIYDEETPLGSVNEFCWVHVYMIICMIVTALYGAGVWVRRSNYTRKLKSDMNDVMGGGDGSDSEATPVATKKPAGMEA